MLLSSVQIEPQALQSSHRHLTFFLKLCDSLSYLSLSVSRNLKRTRNQGKGKTKAQEIYRAQEPSQKPPNSIRGVLTDQQTNKGKRKIKRTVALRTIAEGGREGDREGERERERTKHGKEKNKSSPRALLFCLLSLFFLLPLYTSLCPNSPLLLALW